MKHTVIVVDPSTNKHRKFLVSMDIEKSIPFLASQFMKGEPVTGPFEVEEVPNVKVHKILRSGYSLPNDMLTELEVGDVVPYFSSVFGLTLRKTFEKLGVSVEKCEVPKESSRAFGAVKVINISKSLTWVK